MGPTDHHMDKTGQLWNSSFLLALEVTENRELDVGNLGGINPLVNRDLTHWINI